MDESEDSTTPQRKTCKRLGSRINVAQRSAKTIAPKKPDISIGKISKEIAPISKFSLSPKTPICTPNINCLSSSKNKSENYKLSLSSRLRVKYKKKRLEFVEVPTSTAASSPREEISSREPESCLIPSGSTVISPLAETLHENVAAEDEQDRDQEEKVKKLKHSIDIWKAAFRSAVADLSTKFDPPLDQEELLDKLHISPEMNKYLEES